MEREVDRHGGREHAVDAADEEHRQEPQGEQEGRREGQLAAPQREDQLNIFTPVGMAMRNVSG